MAEAAQMPLTRHPASRRGKKNEQIDTQIREFLTRPALSATLVLEISTQHTPE
jgi:hypothetical protein